MSLQAWCLACRRLEEVLAPGPNGAMQPRKPCPSVERRQAPIAASNTLMPLKG